MRILGLHDGSGCGYYRLVLPLSEMEKNGHEVTLVNYFEENITAALKTAGDYDLVVAERLHKYDGIPSWRRARGKDNRLVFENDDNIFAITKENWVAYNLYEKADIREAITAYSEWADMVTVTTESLAEVFREYNPNTVVLPNCVPDEAFTVHTEPSNRRLRIGWVGGASHGRDVHCCSKPVRQFLNRNSDWELYLGGNDYRPTFNAAVQQMRYEPWHPIADETEQYFGSMDFDIGLCPVLETNFARCKSNIKAVEYGARGIPVIASDVTCYRDYVVHGYNGFLARTEHEWMNYLNLLANDEDLRETMGENNYRRAKAYKISGNWRKWETAYQSMWKVNA